MTFDTTKTLLLTESGGFEIIYFVHSFYLVLYCHVQYFEASHLSCFFKTIERVLSFLWLCFTFPVLSKFPVAYVFHVYVEYGETSI